MHYIHRYILPNSLTHTHTYSNIIQEVFELLYKSGEREIIYTNSHSQYHHSIEEVDISHTIIMLAVVSLVIFLVAVVE